MRRHIHFVGVGGSGLSAIATVLQERGEVVSGSDNQESAATRRLQERGVTVMIGHNPQNIAGADLVIRSSAVQDDHIEVRAALRAGIPVLKRKDFLEELMAGQRAIAVAGTHGKTTTAALIAWILSALGQDPSFVIGSWSVNLGANARAGGGAYFVIEADEYDRMFLGLRPWVAVVTNIEHDHPDCYPTPTDFMRAFQAFASQIRTGGTLIVGIDDAGARELFSWAQAQGINCRSYSLFDAGADYLALDPVMNAQGGFTFSVARSGVRTIDNLSLQVPGMHNVSNTLAALAVVDTLGMAMDAAANACESFLGAARRFDLRGVRQGVMIFDDYAHHPTEIRATLSAARLRFPDRRIWAVWQPHTYSRTRALLDEFCQAFANADQIVITGIYPAREQPPADGFSGEDVAVAVKASDASLNDVVHYIPDFPAVVSFLSREVNPGDIVIVLSAGDADYISATLLAELSEEGLVADPLQPVDPEE